MFDFYSLIVYWGALFVTLLLSAIFNNSLVGNKVFCRIIATSIVSLPLAFISGIRVNVGTDYLNYCEIFYRIDGLAFVDVITKMREEPLFCAITKLVYSVYPNEHMAFFVFEFIMLFVVVWAIYNLPKGVNRQVAIVIWYLIVYPSSLNILRSSIACSFMLLGFVYLIQKKRFAYAMCIFVAVLFHKTAIVGLIFLFTDIFLSYSCSIDIRFSYSSKVKFLYVVYILAVFLGTIFMTKIVGIAMQIPFLSGYEHYLQLDNPRLGFGSFVVVCYTIFPVWLYGNKLKYFKDEIIRLSFLYVLIFPCSMIAYHSEWGGRLMMYCHLFSIIIIPLFVTNLRGFLNKFLYVTYSNAWYIYKYVWGILIMNNNEIFPYKTFM